MSTSYTSRLKLPYPATNDPGWDAVLNAMIAAIDALAPVGGLAVTTKESPSSSLNVAVAAGSYIDSTGTLKSYAGTSSQAIASGSTKYVYLTDAGVLTVGAAWPTTPTYFVPLAIVVTGASTITSITDSRVVCRSVKQ